MGAGQRKEFSSAGVGGGETQVFGAVARMGPEAGRILVVFKKSKLRLGN